MQFKFKWYSPNVKIIPKIFKQEYVKTITQKKSSKANTNPISYLL